MEHILSLRKGLITNESRHERMESRSLRGNISWKVSELVNYLMKKKWLPAKKMHFLLLAGITVHGLFNREIKISSKFRPLKSFTVLCLSGNQCGFVAGMKISLGRSTLFSSMFKVMIMMFYRRTNSNILELINQSSRLQLETEFSLPSEKAMKFTAFTLKHMKYIVCSIQTLALISAMCGGEEDVYILYKNQPSYIRILFESLLPLTIRTGLKYINNCNVYMCPIHNKYAILVPTLVICTSFPLGSVRLVNERGRLWQIDNQNNPELPMRFNPCGVSAIASGRIFFADRCEDTVSKSWLMANNRFNLRIWKIHFEATDFVLWIALLITHHFIDSFMYCKIQILVCFLAALFCLSFIFA